MPKPSYDHAPGGAYRWIIISLAFLGFTLAFVARFTWPPLAPIAGHDLHLSMTQVGLYMTAFYLGYVFMQIPGGWFSDRLGPRLVLSLSLFIQGAATWALAFHEAFAPGFCLRVLCGLAGGCIYGACLKTAVNWFAAKERGLAIGLIMTAPTAGIMAANVAMPWLSETISWRGALEASGLIIMLFSLLLLLLLRNAPVLAQTAFAGPANQPALTLRAGLGYILRNRNIMLVSLCALTGLWYQIGAASWLNTYTKSLGYTLQEAGLITTMFGLMGLLLPPFSGYVAARFKLSKPMLVIAHILMAPAVLLLGQAESLDFLIITAMAMGIMVGMANPVYSLLVTENAEPRWTATAAGLSNAIAQLGALLAPALAGWSVDLTGSFASAWWLLGLGAAAGAVAALKLNTRIK